MAAGSRLSPAAGASSPPSSSSSGEDARPVTGTAPRPLRTFIADHVQAFT